MDLALNSCQLPVHTVVVACKEQVCLGVLLPGNTPVSPECQMNWHGRFRSRRWDSGSMTGDQFLNGFAD